jgi:hypothetical protein
MAQFMPAVAQQIKAVCSLFFMYICIADEYCIGACLRAALSSLCAEGRVWAANLVKGHWNGGQG